MYQNDAMSQNTLLVNDTLVRIFKLVLVGLAAVAALKAAGFIALSWFFLGVMLGISVLLCLLPIVCRHLRLEGGTLKHVNVYCAALLCTIGYVLLGVNGIMLLIIPVGFACLYFDARLIRNSAVVSAVVLIISELLASFTGWGNKAVALDNYFRIGLYILQFGIAVALLIAIAKRAANMLSSTHSFYENINNIFSNAQASAQNLNAADDILLQGVSSLIPSIEKHEEAAAQAEEAEEEAASNTRVKAIIYNLNRSMENAREIMKYTQTMLRGPEEARDKGMKPGDEAAKLEEYARNSKELIASLARYTNKVKEDLSLISIIIDESKLLSINAGAEAENASSGGKGSAILAMKVEKLADESASSAAHIQELLNTVVSDAENTVNSVASAYDEIFKSLELINRTVETLIQWLMYKNMK